jgi:hypothetical protein
MSRSSPREGRTTAPEALHIGLVTRIAGDSSGEAERVAHLLADGPTRAFGRIKRLVRDCAGHDLATHLKNEARAISESAADAEGREGVGAFIQRAILASTLTAGRRTTGDRKIVQKPDHHRVRRQPRHRGGDRAGGRPAPPVSRTFRRTGAARCRNSTRGRRNVLRRNDLKAFLSGEVGSIRPPI